MISRKTYLACFFIQIITIMLCTDIQAYEQVTHSAFNRYIADPERRINGFSLDEFLTLNLGLKLGVSTSVDGRQVSNWLTLGGEKEDDHPRYVNHYHNPLLPWYAAGWELVGESSIVWMQDPFFQLIFPGNTGAYSWQDIRDFYYQFLISTNDQDRDRNLAEMFRGLGQIMHLVQDASSPAHVRHDTHIPYVDEDGYEVHVNDIQKSADPNIRKAFDDWMAQYEFYNHDKSRLLLNSNSDAPIPIAQIVDADLYDGTNPGCTTSMDIGLAEYTNANFFSDDTVFQDYPYPQKSSCIIIDKSIPDPRNLISTTNRQYYYNTIGDGGIVAPVSLYQEITTAGSTPENLPSLDYQVYEAYAEQLVPRAINYSATLLAYFFRGKIDISTQPTASLDHIAIYAKNISAFDENDMMANGDVHLVVKYHDNNGNGYVVIPYGSSGNTQIPRHDTLYDFIPDQNQQIPRDADDINLYMVFRGNLANQSNIGEEDAVCVGFKHLVPVKGSVVSDGNGLASVRVDLVWNNGSTTERVTAYTDENGHYQFYNLSSGTYTLEFSREGYTFNPSQVQVPVWDDMLQVVVDAVTATENLPPVANAGPDQTVAPGVSVTLNGSGSTDPDMNIVSYHWQQTGGPTVTLTNPDAAIAQFTAAVAPGSTLTFELTVTDAGGLQATDTCVITVTNLSDPISSLLSSMVSIPGGTFMMGSTDNEYGYAQHTTPVHAVTLQGFEIGAYEVTQAQYAAIMGTNPSWFQGPGHETYPVEQVSWYDARAFCTALSALTGRTFTLPSEAQWEYACRAGTTTLYSFGDDDGQLGNYAWYWANSDGTGGPYGTHPVGTKLPNAWDLYDMHGNVWEWCLDSWHDNYTGAPNDGSAWEPETGSSRMIRGGYWNSYNPRYCRSASRYYDSPGCRYYGIGFRVLAVPAGG